MSAFAHAMRRGALLDQVRQLAAAYSFIEVLDAAREAFEESREEAQRKHAEWRRQMLLEAGMAAPTQGEAG